MSVNKFLLRKNNNTQLNQINQGKGQGPYLKVKKNVRKIRVY